MSKFLHGPPKFSRGPSVGDRWFNRFKDGCEDFQDDPRSGRPSTSRNTDKIANVREMVTRDRQLTLRIMSDELNINK
jgi:transposase